MKKTRRNRPEAMHDYRCSHCSSGTARNFPGEPIRERGCLDCLHKRQGSLLHALRHLLTTREQQQALQRYIEASQALAKQAMRQPERQRHISAVKPVREKRIPARLPRPETHPMHANSRR